MREAGTHLEERGYAVVPAVLGSWEIDTLREPFRGSIAPGQQDLFRLCPDVRELAGSEPRRRGILLRCRRSISMSSWARHRAGEALAN